MESRITLITLAYKRYDLLKECLLSAEAGNTVPDEYLIVDNGGKFSLGDYDFQSKIRVINPGGNRGVAGGWNIGIKNSKDIRIICNDDIKFNESTITAFVDHWDETQLCYPGWGSPANMFSCFSISDYLFNLVGEFDERISPNYGYFEDNDMSYRIVLERRKGTNIGFKPLPCEYDHVGSATMKSYTYQEMQQHHNKFRLAESNYVKKWGGKPNQEIFSTAYNK